jgi:CDP-diacylglycerol--glycerol-3-phosphate 3-phosphatidyltransferase
MTVSTAIGIFFGKIIKAIVRGLALLGFSPNFLTFLGLVINIWAAFLFAAGSFRWGGVVVIAAGLFDMVDGRVARETNQVTRFGGFFDSVLDRYSDLGVLVGLLVYYASINRNFYVVLTAIAMTGTVLVSYTRARAENIIPKCKVGFLERPERVVLIIIGALFNRMAHVLWLLAVLANITVISRMIYTWIETNKPDEVVKTPPEAKMAETPQLASR